MTCGIFYKVDIYLSNENCVINYINTSEWKELFIIHYIYVIMKENIDDNL